MNRKICVFTFVLFVAFIWAIPAPTVFAAEPIVIGVPTSLGFLEGKESHKAVQLAVSEINAKGGVNVGGTKKPFKVASWGMPRPQRPMQRDFPIVVFPPDASPRWAIDWRAGASSTGRTRPV